MPYWLRNLRYRAQHRLHSLSHHIPYYQTWRIRREVSRRVKNLPKPLRARAAHENLSSFTVDESSNSQPDCLLLSRLPAEIRLQIYEEVFKDDSYKKPSHLSTVKGRLAALPICADCKCENHDDEVKLQRLSLLKTCRQIYSEAIAFLYETWDFHIRDMETLIHLSNTILSQRFGGIRSLYLQLPVCFTHEPYPSLQVGWETLARDMTGLRTLMVGWNYYLCPHHEGSKSSGWEGSLERRYLEPLLKIRGLTDFEMEYTCYSSQEERDDLDADPVDISPEAVSFKRWLEEIVCTPRGQKVDEDEAEGEDDAETEEEEL